MAFSQNQEEQVILSYFGDTIGTLLSIGENDGITLSNTRELILRGWDGILVEPSPTAFNNLRKLYRNNLNIWPLNVAIGHENGKVTFYESGSLLGINDHALVSTIDKSELTRWPNVSFSEMEVDCLTVSSLLSTVADDGFFSFEFVTIDAEGMDYFIASKLPFNRLGTRCICIEYNSKDADKYCRLITPQGFQLVHQNAENLIFFHH